MTETRDNNDPKAIRARFKETLDKLINNAELLYDLAGRNEIWKPKHH